MQVFIINAHLKYPGWSEGGLNQAMVDLAKALFNEHGFVVQESHIENGYDLETEVQRHLSADVVILQTPINWFSAPWIYKKYVDEVFSCGLKDKSFIESDGRTRSDPRRQYGSGGKLMGKKFMVSATWNAPKEVFDNPDSVLYQGKSCSDLFLNITSNYKLIGFDILPEFGVFDIYKSSNHQRYFDEYKSHLMTYVVGDAPCVG